MLLVRVEKMAAENRVGGICGAGGDKEALPLAGPPGKDQVAMAAGPFVAEIAGFDAIAFGDQLHAVFVCDLAAVDGLVAAVPNAEDDAALRGAIDLHAEVAAVPAASHVECPERIFERGDLAIKGGDVGQVLRGIKQVYRSGITARFQIEMRIGGGRAVKNKRFDIAR